VAGQLDGGPGGLSTITGKIRAMHYLLRLLALAAVAFCAVPAAGAGYALQDLRIGQPLARPTPPGARSGSAYFTIENVGGKPDRLVHVASTAAATVELHSMKMDGNVMRMRAIGGLDIPPGTKVQLGSGGYHVMLIDLVRPLAAGDTFAMTLTFDKAGSIDVSARVEALASAGTAGRGAAH
jgi:copper(I)-binding protein